MRSDLGQLVSFNNDNGLELIGIIFEPNNKNAIIIHIHGNYGNFYNNKFIWVMSQRYVENDIGFLSFNLSAHDGLCEGYDNGTLRYIGGVVANYNESILDIDAAVRFVKQLGYSRIILQGHSLGCDKAIDYILTHHIESLELILLSPVDSFAVHKKWLSTHKKESVSEQLIRLKNVDSSNNGLQWLPVDEYGALGRNSEWIYKIPITRNCLISILEGSAFKYLNLESGKDFYIKNRTFAFLGINDGLQMSTQLIFKEFLQKHFKELYVVDDLNSDHDIKGIEIELTYKIIEWVKGFYQYNNSR
ncbi:MAG: hypothetical protein LBU83_08650 [Bacteroidales bacterium]|jgi:predicted esterase|nr:hypothetical protein [Bacteroidales bacterium]